MLYIDIPSDYELILNQKSENFYELNCNRNSLEILGTLDFIEISPASSLLHLIARKKSLSNKRGSKS
jgi:hypothetical protein